MTDQTPPPAAQRSGTEPVHQSGVPLGPTLQEFWRWSASDLVGNTTRGILAEFLVAKALQIDLSVRAEWDAVDLRSGDGLRIEVKSAAYIQSWPQDKHSAIRFSIARTVGWDARTNRAGNEPRRQADVYVFCLLAQREPSDIDPLDVDQWQFWVVSAANLDDELGDQKSLGLGTLQRLAGPPVRWHQLADLTRNRREAAQDR